MYIVIVPKSIKFLPSMTVAEYRDGQLVLATIDQSKI